jgi:CO/xanthine dehydrogenase Mo-binding subunit
MTIGQSVPYVDARARVTGSLDFAINLRLPGMLHGRCLRSPYAHAKVVSIDASRAAALPGVIAVLTRDDLLGQDRVNPTFGLFIRDQPIVALDKVRYAGDIVAAVAAVDEATAARAVHLIDVEYEELPAVFDVEAALQPGAPILHEGPRILQSRRPDILARQPGFEGSNVIHLFTQRKGDTEAGFAEADLVVENTFYSPQVAHVALEPHVAVARFGEGDLTVWSSSQAPHWLALELAWIFKLPIAAVRVIVSTLGGGYGGKIDPTIEPVAAALAWKSRRPVRMAFQRNEEFLTHTKHAARVRIRTGVTKDGTLVAHDATCWYNGGAYAKETPEKIFRGYASMGPYRVPNVHVDSYGVYTNVVPSAAYRGFGIPQVAWAHESQMDIVAERLGMDALELRRRNLLRPGDEFSTGERIDEDLHFRELLDEGAARIGWDTKPEREEVGSKVRSRGMSVIIKGMSAFPSSSLVKLNADGSLNVLASTVEMGQGSLTALAQIASHESGVPLEKVQVSTPDTAHTPWDQMTGASRSTNSMGRAIRAAVKDVKSQLLELAATRMEVAPTDLEIANGMVVPKGTPERALPFPAILGPARVGNVLGRGFYMGVSHLDTETGQGIGSPQWHPAVCSCEVEVDRETGKVEITQLHLGLYVGRMINPANCVLQVQGAALMGVGQALFEEMAWDEAGSLQNPNLSDYQVASFRDVPASFDQTILETPDTIEVHGLGETPLPSVMPAVANAVSRALGVRVFELPITAEKVLRLLEQARGQDGDAGSDGNGATSWS